MELDFLAVVVFDAVRAPASRAKADAQEEEEGRCGWDPYPITRAKAANLVCVWVDPFLSGLTCTRCGEPVVGASSTTVVFRVCGRLAPLEPCITQRIVAAWGPPGGTRAVCNSVKLHFFHQTQRIMGEVGYEFLYSSAFPLGLLLLPPPPSPRAAPTPVPPASPPSAPTPLALGGVYGLFNYNHDTSSADPIAGLWLIITSVRPPHGGLPPPLLLPPPPPPLLLPAATTPLTTPPLAVYALQGPALDEHQRTIVVSNFLVAAIRAISPDFVSCFLNPRTIGRDFQSTCLFQDLPALHDAGPNTCLPPTVAAYGLCGALLCAGRLSPRQFVDGLMARVLRGEAEAEERDLFLRIVRDTLACFTLCGVEGLYWPDMSLGAPVEDQPFPLTFMPAERVFGKDDCEGRMAQILQVARLLQQMHACAKRIGVPAFVATVRATRSGTTLLGGLDAAVVHDLVRAACALGGLFEQGVLDAQITVGDGHLGSVPGGTMVGDALTGHSFGLLFLRPPTTTTTHDDDHGRQYAMHVLEGTGWQRRFNPQFDQPLDAAEEAAYAQIHPALEAFWARTGICKGVFCYRMDEPQENCSYKRPLFGHGSMYFSTVRDRPDFGAQIEHVRTAMPPLVTGGSAGGGARSFRIDTRDLLVALGGGGSKWPRLSGAQHMVALYDAMRQNLATRRRCLRPPPKQEAEFEGLMCRSWAPLTNASVRAWAWGAEEEGGGGKGMDGWVHTLADVRVEGVFLSLPRGCATLESQGAMEAFAHDVWVRRRPRLTIRCLAFMGACVLNAHTLRTHHHHHHLPQQQQ